MNSFGLGLVLNFTDNASSGMRRASQTFQEMNGLTNQLMDSSNASLFAVEALMASGMGLSIVGDQLTQIGGAITNVFGSLMSSVINTGTTIQGQRLTLETLFKSAEEGEKAFQWAKDFAKTSVFNFQDLLPAMTTMKSVGIDVRDEVVATSGATQNLLEYASDLAAVFPNMRNSYGTGVQASMGALKEYIAEGNALSLKRGAGLDITGILGEDKGATMEERTRQVADLIDHLGILGMTANLAGTPMQRLSNAQDLWFNMLTEIADSGVFEKYSSLVAKFTDYLFAIPEEELTNIAKILSDAIVSLMSPLELVLDMGIRFVDWLRQLAKENPNLAKVVITLTAFGGVLLLASGHIMKFAGSILMLLSSLAMIKMSAAQGVTVFGMFQNASMLLLPKLLALVAVAGALYTAWNKNLFGIRDTVTQVFSEIGTILSITFDAFDDNTLSAETWQKAKDLGILPFVEAILQLKYHWDFFVDGFKKGFDGVFEAIDEWSTKFEPIKVSVNEFTDKVTDMIESITGVDMTTSWENVGETIGKLVGVATVLLPIILTVVKVVGMLSNPIGIAIALVGVLYKAWENNFGGIQEKTQGIVDWFKSIDWEATWESISTTFLEVWNTIVDVATQVWEWLEPVFTSLGGLFTSIFEAFQSEDLQSSLTWIGALLIPLFQNIWDIIVSLLPVVLLVFDIMRTMFISIVDTWSTYIVPTLSAIIDRVMDFVSIVIMWVSMLVSAIKPIIQNIVNWVVNIWENWLGDLVSNIVSFVGRVVEFLGFLAVGIYDNVVKPIAAIISFLMGVLLPIISVVVNTIVDVIMIIVDVVGGVVNGIMTVLNGVLDFLMGIFTGDWERAWEGVKSIFTGIWDSIVSIFRGVVNAIIGAINLVIRGLNVLKVPDWVPGIGGQGINISEIPYLNTGGEITGEGVSYLHPNEVVVNSELTKSLGSFLKDYDNRQLASAQAENPTPVINQITTNMVMTPQMAIPETPATIETPTVNNYSTVNNNNTPAPVTPVQPEVTPQAPNYDYSVTFSAGSVVIQLTNATEAELEKAAEKLMKIIERKQQLKQMAVRA